ncbi:MAG: hypothetical protein ABGX16_20665 [Pirellulales bacterium]
MSLDFLFPEHLELQDWLWIVIPITSFIVVAILHIRSMGQTSPLAALSFVVAGPFMGVLISIPYAILENQGSRFTTQITMVDIFSFAAKMFMLGLVAAAATAVITAIVKRNEWFY